ncbi:MAG: alpha/beta fold hydrolase [Archaeoglobaceae archaeon]|nr:alpha/beta fold hydrolase [Archaeoglobaceae archaeon]MDW8118182.1 alpha/beta fold hydrolase [Archaeoglobaceae archaeon]
MKREVLLVGILLALVFSPVVQAKDPVLFVHGWTQNAGNWVTMMAKLTADGWPSNKLFAYTFSNPFDASDGANVRNAQEVANWVNNIKKITGASKIDIVAHSMGGLSTRYYMKFMGGAANVDDYITLGSPHHGTVLADLIGGDMKIGSPFLKQLNTPPEVPVGIQCTSIYSPIDELVQPYTTAMLSGCDNRAVTSLHLQLLVNDQAYNIVKSKLN